MEYAEDCLMGLNEEIAVDKQWNAGTFKHRVQDHTANYYEVDRCREGDYAEEVR